MTGRICGGNPPRSPFRPSRATAILVLPVILGLTLLAPGVGAAAADDTSTVTPTTEITPEPTLKPSPTATATATSTPTPAPDRLRATATAAPLPAPEIKRKHRHRHAATAVPAVPAPTSSTSKRHRRRRSHKRAKSTPTPSPTPAPTATPAVSLSAEDSIAPVTCNGAGKAGTDRPFLSPPYQGWTEIVSYFDHDLPDFSRDGLIVTTTGMQARQDASHQAGDFPAYWSSSVRQYLNYDGHNGFDYNVSYVPIHAAAPGKVIYADWEYSYAPDHGYGRMIMIDHGNGYITLYGHFSKLEVKKGQKVRRGQEIGISGNTGHSTGPHLHFTLFHNCTPVDPYGWTGSGGDPLSAYHGETSTYLWKQQPLVTNPPPNWPGMSQLPADHATRLLLLGLPAVSGGTRVFTQRLQQEGERVLRALGGLAQDATFDPLRAAVWFDGPATSTRLYRLPGVVSIAAPFTTDDARTDVLSALGRAGLAARQPAAIRLKHARSWTASIVRWQGRAFLVGRGDRGKQISLHLSHGKLATVQADPATGSYALDLGPLTTRQLESLAHTLQGSRPARVSTRPLPAPARERQSRPAPRSVPGSAESVLWGALLLAVVAGLFAFQRRREIQNRDSR